MTATRVPPGVIQWHITKTESLPTYFGFHERKSVPLEHLTIHRNSLQRLDHHFVLWRQANEATLVMEHAPAAHTHPLEDRPILPVAVTSTELIKGKQAEDVDVAEAKWDSGEQKYDKQEAAEQTTADDTEQPQQPADELSLAASLSAAGGEGAVLDSAAFEPPLVKQAPPQADKAEFVDSSKAEMPEPVEVAAVETADGDDDGLLAAKQEQRDILLPLVKADWNKPEAGKAEDEDAHDAEVAEAVAEVPVAIPIAEPVDDRLKHELHPELADQEEQLEAERAAAAAVASAGSVSAIQTALAHQAEHIEEQQESDVTTVTVPVAEPVAAVAFSSSSSLHAPHPSLDSSSGNYPLEEAAYAEDTPRQSSIDALRLQHDEEAAAARLEAERLERESLSEAEREQAEMALMTRTQRLAALHESIIRQEALAAAGPAVSSVPRRSPNLLATSHSSKIMEIQQLHLQQQAASGETHTVVEKGGGAAPDSRALTVSEMRRLHEQKIKDEAAAKQAQDETFSGRYLKGRK